MIGNVATNTMLLGFEKIYEYLVDLAIVNGDLKEMKAQLRLFPLIFY